MKNINWCERISYPLPYHCLVESQKQFDQILKKLNAPVGNPFVSSGSDATTHTLQNEKGETVCIVGLCFKNQEIKQILALLVHEAVHIFQEHKREMGEKICGDEFEAYAIQKISQNLFYEFFKNKRRKQMGKGPSGNVGKPHTRINGKKKDKQKKGK